MDSEVSALEENATWTLEDLPPGKRAIGSKWVYRIKYNSDGTIERYKARLVALGNKQVAGEDYGDTFAPVAKMGTVRLFLKVAAWNAWPVYQMDVHNAFLHGDLQEEVYMKPPPEVSRNSTKFYLSQRKFALDILTETRLLAAKPAPFPLDQDQHLALSTSPILSDPTPYHRLIGRMIYLSTTRPDLTFTVHTLAQFMKTPRTDHWEAALRVVRYLKGTVGQRILLSSAIDFQVNGWCDLDYSRCPITRRSVTGYFVQLGESPLSWKTKKQDIVSKSSAEAKYRAMSHLRDELLWIKNVLQSLGVSHP
ncbi:PREDICTED: uncharacterized protein LOC109130827 [Camelina sativa]|uniref:Uncharacterized protein LOC109130827 n=1 Tax=Camelina sativa TaxID=90675 RepID=A0ABM1RBQ0_CAMSA|nr:PREDICTED: uncharacterized protein LOC109130827 [Camelina sativa]